MKRTLLVVAVALQLIFMTMGAYGVQVEPASLAYQGVLTDNTGQPVTGSKTVVIGLYDTPTGGTPFWSETYTLTLKNGQFSVVLGSDTNPLAGKLGSFNGTTYIGVKVGNDAEMPLRQKLTSVAYALQSVHAVNADQAQNAVNATNAANAAVAAKVTDLASIIPPGTIVAYGGTTAPPGWLMCDGAEVSRAAYGPLYAALGTAHGSGDGVATFNLPDYQGRFLRGVDGTKGRDPDAANRSAMAPGGTTGNGVGSVQNDEHTKHGHSITVFTSTAGSTYHNVQFNFTGSNTPWGPAGAVADPVGGNETRPKNAYVNWIIKY